MKKIKFILIMLFITFQVDAGILFNCNSTQSGDWNNPITWVNCDGGIPDNSNEFVTLKKGHSINLNIDAVTVNGLSMESNSQLTISSSVNTRNLTASNNGINLELGKLILESDLVVTNNNANIIFGSINGNYNLIINSNQTTQFTTTIGDNTKIRSITTDIEGTSHFTNDISIHMSSNNQSISVFNDPVTIEQNSNIFINNSSHSGGLIFNNTIHSIGMGDNSLAITNSTSGPTQIKGNISINKFISFRGITRISADIEVHNGDLEFDSFTEIIGDTNFSTNGTGKLIFNRNIVDDGDPITSSIISFNSKNDIMISSIGYNAPIIDEVMFLNTGTVYLMGSINTKNSQVYSGQVIQTHVGRFTSLTDQAYFNKGLDGGASITQLNFANNFPLPMPSLSNIVSIEMGPLGKTLINGNVNMFSHIDFFNPIELASNSIISGNRINIDNNVDLGGFTLDINTDSDQTRILGDITGNVSTLIKSNTGVLSMFGQNSFTGSTIINEGEILIYGSHDSDIEARGQAKIGGTGTINGKLDVNESAILVPGNSAFNGNIGTINVNELNLSTNSILEIQIINTIEHDKIVITEEVNLQGKLKVMSSSQLDVGDTFTIIDNQSNNPINGTLNGINEGGIILSRFQITYQGGDGNDVVITKSCNDNLTVTNNADSGQGSLRQMIIEICPGGVVNFDDAYNINLLSTIFINKEVVIDGSGQIFESAITDSLFNIGIDSFVRLNKVTIQNTNTDTGAITNFGKLSMNEAYFKNNNNRGNGGGAITNFGSLSIEKASFYQNNANQGGAIYTVVPEGISDSVFIGNSTFYQNGNLFTNQGGAIYSENYINLRSVTIIDSGDGSSINGNSIFLFGSRAIMQIDNTLIASSNPSISECVQVNGAIVTSYPNSVNYFIDDGTCDATFSGNPNVGEWGLYGGFAPTIPLLAGSPVINKGSSLYCGLINFLDDQVGNSRTIGIECDIGAVEFIDTNSPEISNISVNNESLDECANRLDEINEFQITFNERVLNAEDSFNYRLIHAGLDQSFGTTDDIHLQAVSAISDGHFSTPTITLLFPDNLSDGIVLLYIDSNITDEFYHPLNNGNDYEHQFRIELGNMIKGGHFDNCNNSAGFPEWQITGNSVTASGDIDDSNASFSFNKLVDSTEPFSISQCINMGSGIRLNMESSFKDTINSSVLELSKGEIVGFNIEMSCIQFDEAGCMGNILETLSIRKNNFSSENQWMNVSNNLGEPNPLIASAECMIEITPLQSNASEFFIDKVRLFLIDDIIFTNSFE